MHASHTPTPEQAARRALGFTLAAAFLGWMFDGLEMGIFPLVASPALGEFAKNSGAVMDAAGLKIYIGHWLGVITACFLLGAALGGLVFGWLGDRVGRVRAMIMSVLAYSLFTGVMYFANSPWQLGLCRFLAAIGMGGEWSLGVALVMEAWPRDKRPLMAGLIGAAANVGYALVALIGIGFHITQESWRWVMLVGAAPALLTLLIAKFVPESERWKESVSKTGVVGNPLTEIFAPGLRRNTILAILFASVALIVTWGSLQNIPTWIDRELTHGANPAAKSVGQLWSSFGAIVGCMIAPLVGARLGRRPVYFGLCLGSLITGSILYRCFDAYTNGLLFMIFVAAAFGAAFYGWLPQYLPELFPTRIRATGQGLAYNFGRILAALVVWNLGAFLGFFDGSYAKAGAAMVFIYVVGMVLIWFAPETRGRPLPE
jgi:MFS family permease